ncbi:hypothetical protein [Nesterenkonia lutea]|uniref:Uncharacterized protein n=1 Tax=Nesterenkonia lutea TaxID=272919 RepID=A0ABR9JD60_9MICC|nr:hypothetical protein [Nesterenkonia lutea]MBE1523723.1 hypothetical protein [Nesterenkonia lutea]
MTTDSENGRSDVSPEHSSSPVSDPELRPEEVVTALLRQQKALLAELSWAYNQLERSQESDLAEIRSRLSQLEYRLAKSGKGRALPASEDGSPSTSWFAGTRKRVEFTVRNPRKALRLAERRLRGQPSDSAPEAGRST